MYIHLLKVIRLKHKKKGNNVLLMKHTYFFYNTGARYFLTHQITEIPSVAHNEEYLHKTYICLTFTSTFYYFCSSIALLFTNMDIIN